MNITLDRIDVSTGLGYDALVQAFEQELGHLDPAVMHDLVSRRAPWSEVEHEMGQMSGSEGLMIIFRANQGAITSLSGKAKRVSLFLVGNPVMANKILDIDPRAGLFLPFGVYLYDGGGADGAVISYNRPSSALATLGRPELAEFGTMLDAKIGAVVDAVCKTAQ